LQGFNVAQQAEGAVGRHTLCQLQHHLLDLGLDQRNSITIEILVDKQLEHPDPKHEVGVLFEQFLAPAKRQPKHLDLCNIRGLHREGIYACKEPYKLELEPDIFFTLGQG
jgi:hypothetical protein